MKDILRIWWTPEMRERLNMLRAGGMTIREAAAAMGVGFRSAKSQCFPSIKKKRAYVKAPTQRGMGDFVTHILVPESVLAERDKRISAAPRDLTGILCGDPPAGFSALDRRWIGDEYTG